MQVCKLISIKTGACPEDCSYCSQSSRYQTEVEPSPLMEREEVMRIARRAQEAGVTRVCLGAAWREVRDGRQFDRVLEIVKDVASLGLEVCCTLGMLNEQQAARLEEAGLYAYNHNLDTSEQFYSTIITTRKYADRLATLANVRKTSVTLCTGGIIGLGESESDRFPCCIPWQRCARTPSRCRSTSWPRCRALRWKISRTFRSNRPFA